MNSNTERLERTYNELKELQVPRSVAAPWCMHGVRGCPVPASLAWVVVGVGRRHGLCWKGELVWQTSCCGKPTAPCMHGAPRTGCKNGLHACIISCASMRLADLPRIKGHAAPRGRGRGGAARMPAPTVAWERQQAVAPPALSMHYVGGSGDSRALL